MWQLEFSALRRLSCHGRRITVFLVHTACRRCRRQRIARLPWRRDAPILRGVRSSNQWQRQGLEPRRKARCSYSHQESHLCPSDQHPGQGRKFWSLRRLQQGAATPLPLPRWFAKEACAASRRGVEGLENRISEVADGQDPVGGSSESVCGVPGGRRRRTCRPLHRHRCTQTDRRIRGRLSRSTGVDFRGRRGLRLKRRDGLRGAARCRPHADTRGKI